MLDCVSVESGARRGNRERLWLCWRRCASAWCKEVLSLAQGLNSVLPGPRAEMCHGFERVREGGRGALGRSDGFSFMGI
jgi:hypothetical protein